MSDKKIPFTKVMREHLMQQEAYYASLTPAISASGTHYLLRDQDVKNDHAEIIETSPNSSGMVIVQVRFPIDDDRNPANGWIKMQDSFLLSGDGRRIHSFDRRFKPNEKATSALWQNRLNYFRSVALPSKESQQKFVDQVLTKPLVYAQIKASSEAKQFMMESGDALQQGLEDYQMRILLKDPGSYPTVEKLDKGYKIKFTWVFDNDGDSKNGRYVMEDYFLIDSDKNFKGHTRQWAVHPDSVASFGSTPPVKLYSVGKPSKALAKAFVDAIVPALFAATQPVATQLVAANEPKREMVRIDPITAQEATGTGKAVEVAGPRGQTVPSVKQTSASGGSYEFSFGKHPVLERNLSRENAGAHLKTTVGGYLRSQLEKRSLAGTAKINFSIGFNNEGYVKKVVATLMQDDGLEINGSSDLPGLLQGAATRIHDNFRSNSDLAENTASVPVSVIIR